MQFVKCSLDVLSKNLSNEDETQFKHLHRLYPDEERLKSLQCKGVYPYEYMDSPERMMEKPYQLGNTFTELCLTEENVSEDDYRHAQTVLD